MLHHSKAMVEVCAPARLHLGFLDLHGGLNRRFGGIGVGIEGMRTRIRVVPHAQIESEGPAAERVAELARSFITQLGIEGGARIEIHEAIPEHAGLGSGSQLALAVGSAIARLSGIEMPPAAIAAILDRGQRSGIGVGAFELGGFLVDGGRAGNSVPPIICRMEFPDPWRFLLALDPRRQGIHGQSEHQAFESLPPMREETSGHLCRLLLLKVLPALREQDCRAFGAGLGEIQACIGDYFAGVQGGRYSSPEVGAVMDWLAGQGATGVGQSSWGPTGFALFDSEARALQALKAARERWQCSGLEFLVCRGRNRPAEIALKTGFASAARKSAAR